MHPMPDAPTTPLDRPRLLALGERRPTIDPDAWVAPGATVAGSVTIAAHASLWYGVVARADVEDITIGAGANVQDGTMLHADPGFPLRIGAGVSVGHGAVLHGATIEDGGPDEIDRAPQPPLGEGAGRPAERGGAAMAVVTLGTSVWSATQTNAGFAEASIRQK